MSHAPPFDSFAVGFSRLAASPPRPLAPSYRGIVVAAPSSVMRWTGRSRVARLPLAGIVKTAPEDLGTIDVLESVTIASCDRAGRTRHGGFEVTPNPARRPPNEVQGGRGMATTRYFNVDLADTLDLPPTPAVYFVYAFLGPYVSNVVRIEVVDPEAAP